MKDKKDIVVDGTSYMASLIMWDNNGEAAWMYQGERSFIDGSNEYLIPSDMVRKIKHNTSPFDRPMEFGHNPEEI